jgi:uncharacterized tellurite resistance protein B-like protein
LKAAVSRQREFLADASSVQFTRNPAGIAGALSKISLQLSHVRHPLAEEASHLFFGPFKRFSLFATHPPIEERIAKVLAVPITQVSEAVGDKAQKRKTFVSASPPNPSHIQGSDLQRAQMGLERIEQLFSFRESHQAKLLFSALIALEQDSASRLKRINPELITALKSFPKDQYLDLVDLALPVLREMPEADQAVFYLQLEEQILEDKNVSAFEIAVLSLVRRHLRIGNKQEKAIKSLDQLKPEALEILRLVASASTQAQGASQSHDSRLVLQKGLETLGWSGEWVERQLNGARLPAAQRIRQLQRLGDLQASDQERLFKALWAVALADNKIQAEEKQLFRALTELLQVPAPAGLFSQ